MKYYRIDQMTVVMPSVILFHDFMAMLSPSITDRVIIGAESLVTVDGLHHASA